MSIPLNKHVINRLYLIIKDLSSKDFLIQTWVKKNLSNVEFSYDELMCGLFDDCSFELFLERDIHNLNFLDDLVNQLEILKEMLNKYQLNLQNKKWGLFRNWYDDKILEDSKFDKIIEQAKKVISLWELDEEAKKYILVT